MEKDTRRIPRLIFKCITNDISDEERMELQEWADKKNSNKELLERLTCSRNIETEMRRRMAVNTQRPLDDMKARIGKCDKTIGDRMRRRTIVATLSTAAVVLLLVGMYLFQTANSLSEKERGDTLIDLEVCHGTTKAVLTMENGKSINLGSDSLKNIAAIAKVEEMKASESETRRLSLTTPRGGEFKITLEDGTEVWLNAQSQLCYPETFDSSERRVSLDGEAYFKVAENTEKPFIVESAGQMIRVTGTEFNINSYREDTNVYTTLVSGGIALRPISGNGGELVLTPGHQAVFDKEEEHAAVRTVDTDVVTSWRTGSFVFENQTLEQIMITLSRWYDFEYEFHSDVLKRIVFMGSVPRYGEFSDVLRILEMSGNIKFRLNGKHLAIEACRDTKKSGKAIQTNDNH